MNDPQLGHVVAAYIEQRIEPLRQQVAELAAEVARLRAAAGAERRGPTAQLKKLIGISE